MRLPIRSIAAGVRRWFVLACLLVGLPATAQGVLQLGGLGGAAAPVDAWKSLQLLSDADASLTIAGVLSQPQRFEPVHGPHANLGVRRDVVWLRATVDVAPTDDGRWIADIDYPSLDRVDVYVVSAGRVVRHDVLGDHLSYRQRPLAARSLATALALTPGRQHDIVLRVQTTSSMIVPLRFVKESAFHAGEVRFQMAQGLAAGIALCLTFYALSLWLASRDPLFLYYAVTIVGVAAFFFVYYGLAPQYLWPGNAWLTRNAAPLFLLVGEAGALLLIERLLDVREHSQRLARCMTGLAAAAGLTALLWLAGLVSYPLASLIGTLFGPLPVLLGVHLALPRALKGDAVARYIVAGWGAYAVGVVIMFGLLRGWVGSNAWTQHAMQVGAMCESIAWLRVIGVRAEAIRRRAERADHEREVLHALAHTDPLTGLPNRRGLNHVLEQVLADINPDRGLAVFLIDLDGFKAVNDRLGHDGGDALLIAAAERLREQLRGADVLARLGGDEFVVVARELRAEGDAWRLGHKLVDAFNAPFVLGVQASVQTCKVGLTIGFALAPQDGRHAADLLKRADAAMYAGKQAGKGTVRRGAASAGLVSA